MSFHAVKFAAVLFGKFGVVIEEVTVGVELRSDRVGLDVGKDLAAAVLVDIAAPDAVERVDHRFEHDTDSGFMETGNMESLLFIALRAVAEGKDTGGMKVFQKLIDHQSCAWPLRLDNFF